MLGAWWDMLGEAWSEVRLSPERSIPAVLGVAVGATALAFLLFGLQGMTLLEQRERERGWFEVWLNLHQPQDPLAPPARLDRLSLTREDAEALRRGSSALDRVLISADPSDPQGGKLGAAPEVTLKAGRTAVRFIYLLGGDLTSSTDLRAFEVLSPELESGRAFTRGEMDDAARVVILQQGLTRRLFGGASPIGAVVRVNGVPFRVVGALGRCDLPGTGAIAVIPYTTLLDLHPTATLRFYVMPKRGARAQAISEVNRILTSRLGWPGHSFVESDDIGESEWRALKVFCLVGMLVLIAAGVNVAGRVYAGVVERLGEIGVRRALGADRRRVCCVVMLESLLLCSLGCLAGGLLGGAMALGCLDSAGLRSSPVLPVTGLLVACAILGAMAGWQGALVAASADPVEVIARKDLT